MRHARHLLRASVAAIALLAAARLDAPARAANLTPPNLTQAVSIANTDLLLVWPSASNGPLESVQWSVAKSLMFSALSPSFLQSSLNLSDLANASTARNNLGLGTVAPLNSGTSGATVPLLNGVNTWSGKQSLPASTTSAAPLNLGQGTAPTSPVNGDCWITTGGMSCRINGGTQTFGTSTGTVSSIATNNGITGGTITTTGTIGLAAIGANTLLANPTASSAVPAATSIPSCSATGSALLYTTSTGFSCGTGYAPLASPNFTSPTVGGVAMVLTNDSRFGGLTQNSQSAAYTLVLADAGKMLYHPSADTTARTYTIPANASVAFPIGTKLDFINDCSAGALTIAITTDTMVLLPAGTTGSRALAACGEATASKVSATRWVIDGTGLT